MNSIKNFIKKMRLSTSLDEIHQKGCSAKSEKIQAIYSKYTYPIFFISRIFGGSREFQLT